LQQNYKKDEAFAEFSEAVRLQPDYPLALNKLGAILIQKGQYAQAIAYLKRALEISPDLKPARANLEQAQRLLGQPAPEVPP
jgi:tetratricopeptide (TPR) repeat protein